MKTLYALLIAPLFLISFLSAQNEEQKINQLITQADSFRKQTHEYKLARETIEQAIELAQSAEKPVLQGNALVRYGRILKAQAEYDQAKIAFEQALAIRTQLEDVCGVASIYNNLSNLTDDIDSALVYAKQAVLIGERQHCHDRLPHFLSTLAAVFDEHNLIDSAILINVRAIDHAQQHHNQEGEVIAWYGLAKRYFERGDYRRAQSSLSPIFVLFQQEENDLDSLLLGQSFELMGALMYEFSEMDSSLFFYLKAKDIYDSFPEHKASFATFYYNLANSYAQLQQFDQGERFYTLAKKYIDRNEDEDFFQQIDSLIELMKSLRSQQKLDDNFNKVLISLVFISFALTVVVILLYLKEKKNVALINENRELRHDLVKNNLKTINNNIENSLSLVEPEHVSFKILLEVSEDINDLLASIGYPTGNEDESLTLKAFIKKMHIKAKKASLMEVQDFSYLDGVEDYIMPQELGSQLNAMITEAFTNVQKHANCQHSSMEFTVDEEGLTIVIEDDGEGFDSNVSYQGLGVKHIKQRAAKIGAKINFVSQKGQGTKVTINLPSYPD